MSKYNNERKEKEPVQESVNRMADRTNWLKFEIEYKKHELLDYENRDKKRAAIITRRLIEKLRDELESRNGDRNNTTLPSDCPVNISELFASGHKGRIWSLKNTEEGREENALSDEHWDMYSELLNKRIVLAVTNKSTDYYRKIKERIDFLESSLKKPREESNVPF